MSLSKATRSGMRGRWQPSGWDACRMGSRAANWAQSGSGPMLEGQARRTPALVVLAHLIGSEGAPPGQDEEQRGDHKIQSGPGQSELPGAAGGLVAVDALDAVGGKAPANLAPAPAWADRSRPVRSR